MLRMWVFVLAIVLVLGEVRTEDDIFKDDLENVPMGRGFFSNVFGGVLDFFWSTAGWLFSSGHRMCGGSEHCPAHNCSDDYAIVYGSCCGCARSKGSVQVKCPPSLQCPFFSGRLCENYNYMMNCCC